VLVKAGEKVRITLKVNGVTQAVETEPRRLLVHVLREDLGLTGTKVGCDTTTCGACTVIMNGRTVKSCTVLAVQANGAEVLTIEGLSSEGKLNPIQRAFSEAHGLQCGYCTSGMIMQAYYLLSRNKSPSEEEIRDWMHGNLCRCTGYQNIVKAIKLAGSRM